MSVLPLYKYPISDGVKLSGTEYSGTNKSFFLKLYFVYKIILNTIRNTDIIINTININNVGSNTFLSPLKYPSGSSILTVNPSYEESALDTSNGALTYPVIILSFISYFTSL